MICDPYEILTFFRHEQVNSDLHCRFMMSCGRSSFYCIRWIWFATAAVPSLTMTPRVSSSPDYHGIFSSKHIFSYAISFHHSISTKIASHSSEWLNLTAFVGTAGLPLQEQFFLTVVKLCLGLPFELLAYQTGVGESTVHRYFWEWMDIIYSKLGYLLKWPDRGSVFLSLPGCFKSKFPHLTCLIDCFEIFIDQPRHLLGRAVTWSNFKKHNTVKIFIGCTPLGSLSFLSKAWDGSFRCWT